MTVYMYIYITYLHQRRRIGADDERLPSFVFESMYRSVAREGEDK